MSYLKVTFYIKLWSQPARKNNGVAAREDTRNLFLMALCMLSVATKDSLR